MSCPDGSQQAGVQTCSHHIVLLVQVRGGGNELASLEMLPAKLSRARGYKVGERQMTGQEVSGRADQRGDIGTCAGTHGLTHDREKFPRLVDGGIYDAGEPR